MTMVLTETYRKVEIYALAVAAYTSVTSNRPAVFKTGLGDFKYTHIQENFFCGQRLAAPCVFASEAK